jgi:hypothetical protein
MEKEEEIRRQRSEIRGRRSEVGDQRSGRRRGRRSEVRGREEEEVGDQGSGVGKTEKKTSAVGAQKPEAKKDCPKGLTSGEEWPREGKTGQATVFSARPGKQPVYRSRIHHRRFQHREGEDHS